MFHGSRFARWLWPSENQLFDTMNGRNHTERAAACRQARILPPLSLTTSTRPALVIADRT